MAPSRGDITLILKTWADDAQGAADKLTPIVYAELRKIAAAYLARERSDHTLQPTELINEAYLKLIRQNLANVEDRSHFYGLAARIMRQILVDHARTRQAEKRGAGLRVTLDTARASANEEHDFDVLAIHEALDKLARHNDRLAQVVELRYFGGLQLEEIAEAISLSLSTVRRSLLLGEAWLSRALAVR